MIVKTLINTCITLALGASSMVVFADNGNNVGNNAQGNNTWMPQQPGNAYWQAPNWSGFNNMPPAYNPAQRPPSGYYNYRPPMPQAYQPPAGNYYPNAYRQPPAGYYAPGNNNYQQQAPQQQKQNMNQQQAPQGPNRATSNMPDNGASAYNTPGYHRYQNNGWGNNNMWGNSGPRTWMNPNKSNMEQGWDDMINAPSRMGEMPGGWNAPEISMPNPIDMGDQFQDNIKDLPEQIRDMDVGN